MNRLVGVLSRSSRAMKRPDDAPRLIGRTAQVIVLKDAMTDRREAHECY